MCTYTHVCAQLAVYMITQLVIALFILTFDRTTHMNSIQLQ